MSITIILVETSQFSVIPLVQSLILVSLETFLSNLFEDDSESVVRALEDRSVGNVEFSESGFLEVLGSFESFGTTLLGKGRVLPSVGIRSVSDTEEGRERREGAESYPVKRLSCQYQ